MLTKDELLEKLNKVIANSDGWGITDLDAKYEKVYDKNYGDGNEMTTCYYFPLVNKYVQAEGTYSSWDSSTWDSVYFAKPFTHTETRAKPFTHTETRYTKTTAEDESGQ